MWTRNDEPLGGSLAFSAPVAAPPIVELFLMLGVWRAPAWKAALSALATAFVLSILCQLRAGYHTQPRKRHEVMKQTADRNRAGQGRTTSRHGLGIVAAPARRPLRLQW